MPTFADLLRETLAEREATGLSVRELWQLKDPKRERERIANPRRYAARLRAEAYRRKQCPLQRAVDALPDKLAEIDKTAKPLMIAAHVELSSVAEKLKRTREPIKAKVEALRGLREFGGNINRHLVYHLIDKHRRGTSFTPLVQQFLRDYKKAHELDHTLTREQFISTYADQIIEFLSTYTLTASELNAVRIEYLTLRVLVSIVAPSREKYGSQFESACLLVSQAEARFNTLCKRQILKTRD